MQKIQILVKKDTLDIVSVSRGITWDGCGMYSDPIYACIETECSDDLQPKSVVKLGDTTPVLKKLNGKRLDRFCDPVVYQDAEIEFELVPLPEGL